MLSAGGGIPYAKLPNDAKFPEKLTFSPQAVEWIKNGADGQGFLYYINYTSGVIEAIPAVNKEEKETKKEEVKEEFKEQEQERKSEFSLEKELIEKLKLEIATLNIRLEKLEPLSDEKSIQEKEKLTVKLNQLISSLSEKQKDSKKAVGKLKDRQVSAIAPKVEAVYDRKGQPYPKFVVTAEAKSTPTGSGGGRGGNLHKMGAGALGIGSDNLAGGLWRGKKHEDEPFVEEHKEEEHKEEDQEQKEKDKDNFFIKEIRTRASANMQIERNPVFMVFFRSRFLKTIEGEQGLTRDVSVHSEVYVRELPLISLQKFFDALYEEFYQGKYSADPAEDKAIFEEMILGTLPYTILEHVNYEIEWMSRGRDWFKEYFSSLLLEKKVEDQNKKVEIDALIKALFDPSFKNENAPLQMMALELAVKYQRGDILEKLLSHEVTPQMRASVLLHMIRAIKSDEDPLFPLFIKFTKDLTADDILEKKHEEESMLDRAMYIGNDSVVKHLFSKIGNKKLDPEDLQKYLINAMEAKNQGMIGFTLSLGADGNDETVRRIALTARNFQIFSLLREYKVEDEKIADLEKYQKDLLSFVASCQDSKMFTEIHGTFNILQKILTKRVPDDDIPEVAILKMISVQKDKEIFFRNISQFLLSNLIRELLDEKPSLPFFENDSSVEIVALSNLIGKTPEIKDCLGPVGEKRESSVLGQIESSLVGHKKELVARTINTLELIRVAAQSASLEEAPRKSSRWPTRRWRE